MPTPTRSSRQPVLKPLEKLVLKPAEVALVLNIGKNRVYDMIHTGELPSFREGNTFLVPTLQLKQWIDRRYAADQAQREQDREFWGRLCGGNT